MLSDEEMQALCSVAVSRAMLPGEELFRRGDDASSMYVIDTGEVRLSFDDGIVDKLLGPGHFFGELSVFIGQHQRFAHAIAEAPGMLYEITTESFQGLLASHPATAPTINHASHPICPISMIFISNIFIYHYQVHDQYRTDT